MIRKFLTGKWIQIVLHILLWSVLIIIPLYISGRYEGNRRFFKWFFYKDLIIYGILFYINYLVLVPRLFFNGKRLVYFLSAVLLVTGFYFLSRYAHEYIASRIDALQEIGQRMERDIGHGPDPRLVHAYNFILTAALVIFLSLGLGALNRQAGIEKRQKELEKEKLNSELVFLKSQISPHFLFNTLNNIYSLIGINTGDAQEAVLKLSKLMRYLLDESEKEEIRLEQEINFMNHYIDLMKLRLTDKVSLRVSFPEKHGQMSIPPLLFIPFIENAFKHGISYRSRSSIDISLGAERNGLSFRCRNSLVKPEKGSDDPRNSGIGLENAKRRLGLLFPENHKLEITRNEDTFEVSLDIRFKDKAT